MLKFLVIFSSLIISLYANLLQDAINNAKAGSTIKLGDGIYKGAISINKPITIIGKGKNVIIDGMNIGTVININSSNVILKNLTIINSGNRLDKQDSAIKISSSSNSLISSCIIKNTLYGIQLAMVHKSIIQNNKISSKKLDLPLRGDAIKLFYSNDNLIKNNEIYNSRDLSISYSNNNTFEENHIEKSRFALHFMNSNKNIVKNNYILLNSVGFIFTGAKNTIVKDNQIISSKGKAGIAVLIKGVNNFNFSNNILKYNNKALYIDAKHNETEIKRFITNNEISFNNEAFHFHGAIKQNLIKNNRIIGNLEDVVKSTRGDSSSKNIILNNYWDRYSGFDKNKDNIGDTPYKIYLYTDKLGDYNNKIKFFYATPIISIINFMLDIAPFIEPVLIIEDTEPLLN